MSARYGPERKATLSQAYRFLWVPSDGFPSSAPTVTFQFSAGDVAVALAAVRAADVVSSLNDDRRRLTLATGSNAADLQGVIGDYSGECWLDGPGVSVPVRVLRLVSDAVGGSVVELADALPHSVTIVTTTRLRWNVYQGALTSVQVGATVQRFVRWSLPWTRTQGSSSTTQTQVEHGILHVVRTPFDTGLTDQDLRSLVPDVGRMVPGGQGTWFPQREAAFVELVEWLRAGAPSGLYEDQAPGDLFRAVHACLTGAYVFDGLAAEGKPGAAEVAARLRTTARERFDRILPRVSWWDVDADGVVDSGETDYAAAGLGGLFRSNVTDPGLFDDDTAGEEVVYDRIGLGDDR